MSEEINFEETMRQLKIILKKIKEMKNEKEFPDTLSS